MPTINELEKIIIAQQKEIDFLKSKIEKLESKKHNERGAGRKSTLSKEKINRVNELHLQGLSYGAIAKEVGISKAYVYKLINKQENKIMTEDEYNRYREHTNSLRKGLRNIGHNHAGTKDLPTYEEYLKIF